MGLVDFLVQVGDGNRRNAAERHAFQHPEPQQ
jgi:hypothetical protein